MEITDLLIKYIENPKDSSINFELGCKYEDIGQTASAAGYYLRSVEFGNDNNRIYINNITY